MSQWASRNPLISRILIASFHLLAIANAIFLGLLFYTSGWITPSLLVPVLVTVFCGAYLTYPSKKERVTKKVFWQRKRRDFIMALCYPLLITVSLNNSLTNDEHLPQQAGSTAEITLLQSSLSSPPPAATSKKHAKAQKREARKSQLKAFKLKFKELKTQIRAWKKAHKGQKDGKGWGRALLTLLVIAGAVFLAYLLAVLSCSLSCNGMEGLAVFVFFAGLAGIIGLSIIALKGVFKNRSSSTSSSD